MRLSVLQKKQIQNIFNISDSATLYVQKSFLFGDKFLILYTVRRAVKNSKFFYLHLKKGDRYLKKIPTDLSKGGA